MRAKTGEELYLLLRVHSRDYTLQALTVADEEFRRRRLDESAMSRIMASAEKALGREERETWGGAKACE